MMSTRNASGARLRKWNESKEARADRIVIMHPESMPVVTENPPSFSTVQVLSKDRIVVVSYGPVSLRCSGMRPLSESIT
jgi:hypothetical protein